MNRHQALTGLYVVTLVWSSFATAAGPAQSGLVIGLYTPNQAVQAGRAQRIRAIERLAAYLSSKLGVPVRGRSFARSTDLQRAVKRGQVQLAVVGATHAGQRGWQAFASLVRQGKRTQVWSVVTTRRYTRITELKGATLAIALPKTIARRFVTKVLFEGEVQAAYFRWLAAPDAASAIRATQVGKAAAAIVPASATVSGLSRVFVSQGVPLPQAVVVGKLSPRTAARARAALLAWRGKWLGFDGWRAPLPEQNLALRQRMRRSGRKKPIVSEPRGYTLKERGVFVTAKPAVALPDVREMLSSRELLPDAI